MNPVVWDCPRTSWRLAFLLSGLLHAGAGLVLALIPGPAANPVRDHSPPIIVVSHVLEAEAGGGSESVLMFPRAGEKPGNASESLPTKANFLPPQANDPGPLEPVLLSPAEQSAQASSSEEGTAAGVGETTSNGVGKGQGPGWGGGKNGTSFFNIPTQGQKIVYVIDRSSSMGKQGALDRAKRELSASLASLPEKASFQIIVYNSTAHFLIDGESSWLPATPANRQRAALELAQLEATRRTEHELALKLALALQPDAIFFLTDADDLDERYLGEITRRNQGRAAIHVIELDTANLSRPNAPLQVFARQNRGIYRAVDLNWHEQ